MIGKSLGVLILSALCLPLLISSVLAEGNETTTTTTTSITIPQIDVAPLINLVVALLPAILVIVIIRAVLGSIAGYARLVRIKHKLSGWFNAASNSRVVRVLPAVLMVAFLCFGFFSGMVAADTGSSTTGIDVSAMIDLVMSLLPLIIVLVIVKALMNAFKGL